MASEASLRFTFSLAIEVAGGGLVLIKLRMGEGHARPAHPFYMSADVV